jgi:hypothetical protein
LGAKSSVLESRRYLKWFVAHFTSLVDSIVECSSDVSTTSTTILADGNKTWFAKRERLSAHGAGLGEHLAPYVKDNPPSRVGSCLRSLTL